MGGGSSKQKIPKGHKTVPEIKEHHHYPEHNVRDPRRYPVSSTSSIIINQSEQNRAETTKEYLNMVREQLQNKEAQDLAKNGVLILGHKSHMDSVCEYNTDEYTRQYIYALIHKNDGPNLARLLRSADVGYAVFRSNAADTINQKSGTRCKSCEIEFTNLFKIGEDGEQDYWSAKGGDTKYIEELEWWIDANREKHMNADVEKDIKDNYYIFFAIERSLCEKSFDLLGKIHSAIVTPRSQDYRMKHTFE